MKNLSLEDFGEGLTNPLVFVSNSNGIFDANVLLDGESDEIGFAPDGETFETADVGNVELAAEAVANYLHRKYGLVFNPNHDTYSEYSETDLIGYL